MGRVLLDSFAIHAQAFRTVLEPAGIHDFDYLRVTGADRIVDQPADLRSLAELHAWPES